MKFGKKIFVGSIVLLLATTSLIASAGKNEISQTPSTSHYETYSLGQLNVTHQPVIAGWGQHHGMDVKFWPAKSYYFNSTEVNGVVYVNFTLTVKHCLNKIPTYFAKFLFPHRYRGTWINCLWIRDPKNSEDIYSIEDINYTTSTTWVYYNITATGQTIEITNHSDYNLTFWLWGAPAITPIPFVQSVIATFPSVYRNFLAEAAAPYDHITITIHPHPI